MAEFYLKVIASDKVFFSGYAENIIVPALDGQYSIMAHHDDVVVAIKPGEVYCKRPDGTWVTAVVGSGFAHSSNNRTTILVDTAEYPEDIDEVRAREALERAQEEMRQKQSVQEYKISQATLARALARLSGKKRDRNQLNI
jgi:F-type H+-transporting ATPase subunit epsilon